MPKFISALCTLAVLSWMGASALRAETVYAINDSGPTSLFSFDSATPGVITTPKPITGLVIPASPYDLAFRPADGQLYMEAGGYVYRIDPATARATPLFSNSPFFGISAAAFNPVTGLLRTINTRTEQALSFRVNVDTGVVIQDGISPGQPRGLAYTNAYAGANTTTLYALVAGSLYIVDPENQSRFNIVGQLNGPGVSPLSSLSISGLTGTAYASFASQSGGPGPTSYYSSQFYTVDLSTGAGTLVGPIGDGMLDIEAIAAPVGPSRVAPVPEPTSWALLGAGFLFGGVVRRWRARDGAVS